MSQERRGSERLAMQLNVLLHAERGDKTLRGTSTNLSETGIFVAIDDFIPCGNRVDLVIESPHMPSPIATSGIVAHVVPDVGIGIQFARQGDRTRDILSQFLAQLKAGHEPK